jgi:hypothetical protein
METNARLVVPLQIAGTAARLAVIGHQILFRAYLLGVDRTKIGGQPTGKNQQVAVMKK